MPPAPPPEEDVVRTTCPYCGVGCGLTVSVDVDGAVQLRGDDRHPANQGRLCSKGAALPETLDLEGRLLYPVIDGRRAGWDEALDRVAERFRAVIDQEGPDAVAFYVSGQLLTEDYYLANKLMKGFIGSANIDTNSRLCMASSVAGHKRAFGADTVPGCYEDWDQADLLVLTGSNAAWCHPVLYQRAVAAKKARPDMQVVVIDPRRTATCEIADLHLPLAPGTDVMLFSGLLSWLAGHGHLNDDFVERHTNGVEEALRQARWHAPTVAAVAAHCGLDAGAVADFYRRFAANERTVTVYSQGVNQSSSGTDKVNAIINCHLYTGRIGRPGMGPFSVTGQPNAMGGREVGALANQLAAHLEFARPGDRELLARFWGVPAVAERPGRNAVELFRAVERGEIKALWVMATNPAVSLPDAGQVRRALERCDFLVVSDCVAETDTARHAHVRLPALAWGEKDGTVTNSERRVSRQRAFLPPPGEARPDWWILARVAERMGYPGFEHASAAEVFDEHVRLSGFENGGRRDFDLSGLAGLSAEAYDGLEPVQWPLHAGETAGEARFFASGGFFTPDGKADFVAVSPKPPGALAAADFPLVLNTGRVRDQWHTMTRTGKSPRLSGHVPEPYAELHPVDAATHGVLADELVRVESAWGRAVLRARVSERQRRGSVFVPMHWNEQFASTAVAGALVNPYVDPHSGQPEFKHTPVRIAAYRPAWYGFALSREPINLERATYWVRSRRRRLWHYELAGEQSPADWAALARAMLGDEGRGEWSEMRDPAQQGYRAARFREATIVSCLFVAPGPVLPPRDWLIGLFDKPELSLRERLRVLAGSPASARDDAGELVCSCFNVGRNAICRAVATLGLLTPEAIGEHLKAGTNCGSCIPELRALIAAESAEA